MKEAVMIVKNAVDDILFKINREKMDPQEAVTKVAQEQKLGDNFIKRACEVINVALTFNHFRKNAEAKDTDFPIVDYGKVISSVYGDQHKTAAELRSDMFPVISEVSGINTNKMLHDPAYKEAYMQILKSAETDGNTEFEMSIKGMFEKCADYLDSMEKELDDARSKEAHASWEYIHTFSNIMEKFAKDAYYRTPFEEFESQVYSMYGDRAMPYVDLLYKSAALTEPRGVHDDKYHMFEPCKEAALFDKFMQQKADYLHITKAAEELAQDFEAEKGQLKEAYRKYAIAKFHKNIAPNLTMHFESKHKPEPQISENIDPVAEAVKIKKQPELEALDESVLTPGQRNLPHGLKKAIIASKKRNLGKMANVFESLREWGSDKAKDLSKPSSSIPSTSKRDNLNRVLMMQELIATDPILSGTSPDKIVNAYEQFTRIAPELSNEKEIVRAHLRQAVSGQALSAYDAQQDIDANTALLKQKKMQEGSMKPDQKM